MHLPRNYTYAAIHSTNFVADEFLPFWTDPVIYHLSTWFTWILNTHTHMHKEKQPDPAPVKDSAEHYPLNSPHEQFSNTSSSLYTEMVLDL